MKIHGISSLLVAAVLGGCTAPTQGPPPKSPNGDDEPPATTTGNGEVIGADREAPAQKIEEGVRIDAKDGVKPAAHPPGE